MISKQRQKTSLKEHDEGVGDGKADAEDEYEEVDNEHLVGCTRSQDAKMVWCYNYIVLRVLLSPCNCHSC